MPAWFSVLFWWLAFAATHLVLSSIAVRRPLIARLGERAFQGLYSLVAFATFIPLVIGYWRHKHAGPLLWSLQGVPGLREIGMLLSAIGFVLIVLAVVQPSPTSIVPGAATSARGVMRITRHPLFAGLGLWGLAHSLLNGYLSDVLFFGGFLIFAFVGGAHQDARKRLSSADTLSGFYAETSAVPFAAIVAGRNRFVLAEIPLLGVAIGAVVAVVLYLLHPRLFIG